MAKKSWEERKAEKIYWQIQHDYGLTSELEVAIARRFYPQIFLEKERLERLLRGLVKGIDDWNEDVQKIIGHIPDYHWGTLEEARRAVQEEETRND